MLSKGVKLLVITSYAEINDTVVKIMQQLWKHFCRLASYWKKLMNVFGNYL